jgi:hypothetical protein
MTQEPAIGRPAAAAASPAVPTSTRATSMPGPKPTAAPR